MILEAFFRALGQLGDRPFRTVLMRGVLLSIGLLFGFSALLVWGVGVFVGDEVTLPWIGPVGWIDNVLSWAMVPLMAVLSIFLMIPVASAITSIYLDEVAQAVEDRHYPGLGAATPVPFADGVRDTLGFLGVLVAANLLALVLYLIFAPLAPFIFYGLNGFLLGREYITLAATRRIGREGARQMRKTHFATIWAAGVLMALPLSVPLLNLLVPVLGAATFTHMFHGFLRRQGGA